MSRKFYVCVTRMVEETAKVAKVRAKLADGTAHDDFTWGEGDTIHDEDCYAVLDKDKNCIWER